MSVTFNEIPSDNLVPIFATEFDNTLAAHSGAMPWKNLLIGQASNSSASSVLTQIFSDEQADTLYGQGSEMALMCRAFRKNSKTIELWALPVQDTSSAAAATGTLTVAMTGSTATVSGYIPLLIGGQSVRVNVTAGDTPTEVAASIAAAITDKGNLPVTATSSAAVVTLTAKNKGAHGNSLSIESCFYDGETLPSGISLTIVAMSGGGAEPLYEDLTLSSIISGVWFNAIVIGSNDSANIAYIQSILDDRWLATKQFTGVCHFALNGTLANFTTLGASVNSKVLCGSGIVESPTPFYEQVSAIMGVVAPIALTDPAVPLCNWAVAGIVAPKKSNEMLFDEKNALLKKGMSLLSSDGSTVYLRRMVTTYKTNAAGASDTSYRQLEKIHTLSYLRWDWNNYLAGRYPHAKLADDGNDYGPDQTIMTPSIAKAEILGRYKVWMKKGLVQDYDTFKSNVVCQKDGDDTMVWLINPDLMDQLLIGKTKMQFV
jgi:phage tail sheath gpL-like